MYERLRCFPLADAGSPRRTFICSRTNCEPAWNGGWRRAHGKNGGVGTWEGGDVWAEWVDYGVIRRWDLIFLAVPELAALGTRI
jgi:hypothetical protein